MKLPCHRRRSHAKPLPKKPLSPTSGKLRRLTVAVTTACVLATSTSAWAKSACYSAAEYDAEQAVRLHTELMVIGLTCNSIEADRKLFAKYQQFTTKNRTSLLNWEKVLIGHFSQTGKSNHPPVRRFPDRRRQRGCPALCPADAAGLLPDPQRYVDSQKALSLSDADLKRYVSEGKSGEIGIAPPCGVTVAELLDSDLPATTKASKPSVQGKSGDKGSKSKPARTRSRPRRSRPSPPRTSSRQPKPTETKVDWRQYPST